MPYITSRLAHCLRTLIPILLLSGPALAHALPSGLVEQKLPDGKIAVANYHAGKPGLPAVLILHGFLQTREFSTITRMGDALINAGYTVLMPTLSLGVSRRQASLACEALHTHTMESDIGEIALWVEWLAKQHHQKIILAGHSFGSLQLLAYASQRPRPNLMKVISVSLVDADERLTPTARKNLVATIRQDKARSATDLITRPLSYCKNFTATPDVILSYLAWSRSTTFDAIRRLKQPFLVIMGSKDDRMGADWPDQLKAHGVPVYLTTGANHFFDEQFEFDLQDALLDTVKSNSHHP